MIVGIDVVDVVVVVVAKTHRPDSLALHIAYFFHCPFKGAQKTDVFWHVENLVFVRSPFGLLFVKAVFHTNAHLETIGLMTGRVALRGGTTTSCVVITLLRTRIKKRR